MAKVNRDKLVKDLKLKPFGQKGWLSNQEIKCPQCGRTGKIGFNINKPPGVVHCFICEYSQSIITYLKSIDRSDLYSFEKTISIEDKIGEIDSKYKNKDIERISLEEIEMPRGFKRIYENEYLRNRGYTDEQFKKYSVGITNHFLEKRLKNYLIFPIVQKQHIVAWLARSTKSYEWHSENLKKYKRGECALRLRYINSNQDFSKILGGLDELTENTKIVIITEGFFDKLNIDRLLGLYNQEEVKCVCTFGNTVKMPQISLLQECSPNTNTIILMYDAETIRQTKQYGLILSKKYKVKVAELKDAEIDPGNISFKKLEEVLCNLKDILYFYTNRIN